jgi:hypothetical protein
MPEGRLIRLDILYEEECMINIDGLGERSILLVEINGRKYEANEMTDIFLPTQEKSFWKFTFKNGKILNATGNIILEHKY